MHKSFEAFAEAHLQPMFGLLECEGREGMCRLALTAQRKPVAFHWYDPVWFEHLQSSVKHLAVADIVKRLIYHFLADIASQFEPILTRYTGSFQVIRNLEGRVRHQMLSELLDTIADQVSAEAFHQLQQGLYARRILIQIEQLDKTVSRL